MALVPRRAEPERQNGQQQRNEGGRNNRSGKTANDIYRELANSCGQTRRSESSVEGISLLDVLHNVFCRIRPMMPDDELTEVEYAGFKKLIEDAVRERHTNDRRRAKRREGIMKALARDGTQSPEDAAAAEVHVNQVSDRLLAHYKDKTAKPDVLAYRYLICVLKRDYDPSDRVKLGVGMGCPPHEVTNTKKRVNRMARVILDELSDE